MGLVTGAAAIEEHSELIHVGDAAGQQERVKVVCVGPIERRVYQTLAFIPEKQAGLHRKKSNQPTGSRNQRKRSDRINRSRFSIAASPAVLTVPAGLALGPAAPANFA